MDYIHDASARSQDLPTRQSTQEVPQNCICGQGLTNEREVVEDLFVGEQLPRLGPSHPPHELLQGVHILLRPSKGPLGKELRSWSVCMWHHMVRMWHHVVRMWFHPNVKLRKARAGRGRSHSAPETQTQQRMTRRVTSDPGAFTTPHARPELRPGARGGHPLQTEAAT